MASRLMVGMDFFPHIAPVPAIQKLRQEFDPKFDSSPRSFVTIVPPFTVDDRYVSKVKEEVGEVIENFFFGGNRPSIQIIGMDVHGSSGSTLIYLNPLWDEDMLYVFEALNDACKEYVPKNERAKNNDHPFLAIGRFGASMRSEVTPAIEQIKKTVSFPFDLKVESFTLYKRQQGIWNVAEAFDPSQN